ncbi:carbohydrate esterase family 12 protein [Parathielavia hyrcaniae]|uniref:Carbohydrate esterase family 12 protein n=1 Tax=Parathielavia hyrcaniae TaxID=113614 RepID=A0AAN6T2G7_9PEZI|nr:carbohydrate esterase family 12 protein [Parathielavia hyrcaniae]
MLSWSTILAAGLAVTGAQGSPVELVERAPPILYLAGDSTMARGSGAYTGWGDYIAKYVTIPVVNKAIGGRSARSYTNEGRFAEIARLVKRDDIVVIEFGHNDGGSPNGANDNGRSDCPGTGNEVCRSGKTGEIGARVIISSQTPNNLYEGGSWLTGVPRFVGYAALAARNVGNGATFVDHFRAVANMFLRLRSSGTNALFPVDHTHTNARGADLVAQAFAQAINRNLNGTTPLRPYLKNPVPNVF